MGLDAFTCALPPRQFNGLGGLGALAQVPGIDLSEWPTVQIPADVKIVRIPEGMAGTEATLKIMKKVVLSPWGARNPQIVQLANAIRDRVPSKDYVAEADAIFKWVKANIAYKLDPAGLEWIQTPTYTMKRRAGDCFVKGTKVLLREGHRLVPIESLRIGDEVWGLDRWSRVENTWDKGVLPTWQIRLNNGSVMRLTPDHKVWIARCAAHEHYAKPCSCPVGARKPERIYVRDLKPGAVVTSPAAIAYGQAEMDPDRAYIEGLYLSDGWSEDYRFAISGKDGFPKEAQKREVQEICSRLGIATAWQERYIRVNDPEWTQRLSAMGTKAPQKHALSINFMQPVADRLLQGIMADSGKNTNGNGRTFTSTSYELWLQTRVLLKMQGKACSSRFIADHGGLGKNPIWRLGIRDEDRSDGKPEKLLRVKEVIRDEAEADCFDVATDDHYVWLPEADWTTSQCDDAASLTAALSIASGHRAAFRTVKGDPGAPDRFSHVYPVIGVVKAGKTLWLPADSTQRESSLGWDPPDHYGNAVTWVIDPNQEDETWR
jgi:hypothetical protein